MDYKTKWKYRHTINKALKGTNYDAQNVLLLALLISIPLGLIINGERPGMILGFVLLPLPLLYYLTFYRWHAEYKRGMQGFGSSTSVTVGGGMLDITDGNSHANLPLENVRELAVYIPEKEKGERDWLGHSPSPRSCSPPRDARRTSTGTVLGQNPGSNPPVGFP